MKNKNWLSDNISSLIAITFLLNTFTIFYLVLLKQVKTSDSTTITIIQTVSNILMLIIGFYFGSSKKGNDVQINPNETDNKQLLLLINQALTTDDLELLRGKIPPSLMSAFEKKMSELKSS